MFKKSVFVAVAVAVLGVAGSANAGTIFSASTLPGCANCYGLTYTLTVGDNNDAVGTTFDAILKITGTLTVPVNSPVTHLTSVSFKVANDVIPPLTLGSAPTAWGLWATSENNINNANCSGGGNGYVCSQTSTPLSLGGGPLDLKWTWTFSLAAGTTPQPLHIGAKLNNANGNLNGQILSQSSLKVPDGGMTLSLLGLAMAGVATLRRRMH